MQSGTVSYDQAAELLCKYLQPLKIDVADRVGTLSFGLKPRLPQF